MSAIDHVEVLDQAVRAAAPHVGAPALDVFRKTGLRNMGVSRRGIFVDPEWLAEALVGFSQADRWAALVGAAAHELTHLSDDPRLSINDQELAADKAAKETLKKLGLPFEPYRRLLVTTSTISQSHHAHPAVESRLATLHGMLGHVFAWRGCERL